MLPVISDPESLTTPAAGDETDSRFGALDDPRRRAVLRYLDEHDCPASITDLADHLLLENHGNDEGALASAGNVLLGTRRRVQLSLRHSHVPKLADAGVVDADFDANTVVLRDRGLELLVRIDSTVNDGVAEREQFKSLSEASAPQS